MNRVYNSLKKIKFNPLVNKFISNQGKNKYSLINSNVYFKPLIIRKYTTFSNPNPNPNQNPNQNHKFWIIFIMASIPIVICNNCFKK